MGEIIQLRSAHEAAPEAPPRDRLDLLAKLTVMLLNGPEEDVVEVLRVVEERAALRPYRRNVG